MLNNSNNDSKFKQQFRNAMINAGITPPDDVIEDGKIHRFSSNEKPNNQDGWYVLFGDGIPAGEFGCWRTGIHSKWKADLERPYTPEEIQSSKKNAELIKSLRKKEFEAAALEAKKRAISIWSKAQLAVDHPYLLAKSIKPYIARQYQDTLILPLYRLNELTSLQFIDKDSKKVFLKGGVVSGSYCTLGEITLATPICICEGYATGASIHEAANLTVCIAFNSGNLLKVALEINTLYPDHKIIIAGDDDFRNSNNPGKKFATEAAEAINAKLIFPVFSDPRQDNQTDFNDMARDQGLFAVAVAFDDIANQDPYGSKKFSLNQFSLNGQSEAMKKQMLEDKYILGRIAIYGQYTVFYASPNVGKTLLIIWMIIKAIESGDIQASDIFYINADDDHKGLTYKVALAEEYGFQMLSPSYQGFELAKFFDYIKTMIKEDTAKGKIIILDTLKKFTDVMRKDKASEFGKMMREFVLRGGSIICLGHVNKHKTPDGKSVYGGTSDIADDADCYFMLEEIQVTNKSKTVRFENRKSRGNVDKTATFVYTNQEVRNYQELLDSVQPLSEAEAQAISEINIINNLISSNQKIIDAITVAIKDGVTLKTDLIKFVVTTTAISKSKVSAALDKHTGTNYSKGHRWICTVGEKNAHNYALLKTGGYQDQM